MFLFFFCLFLIYSLAPLSTLKQKEFEIKGSFWSSVILTSNKVYKVPSTQYQGDGATVTTRSLDIMALDEARFYTLLTQHFPLYPSFIPRFYGTFNFQILTHTFGQLTEISLDELKKDIPGIIIERCLGIEFYSFLEKHFKTMTPLRFIFYCIKASFFFDGFLQEGLLPGDFKSKNLFFDELNNQFHQMVDHATTIMQSTDRLDNRPVYLPTLIFFYESLYNMCIRFKTQQGRTGTIYKNYLSWLTHINSSVQQKQEFPSDILSLWTPIFHTLYEEAPSDEWKKIVLALDHIFQHYTSFMLFTSLPFNNYLQSCFQLNQAFRLALSVLNDDIQNQTDHFCSLQFTDSDPFTLMPNCHFKNEQIQINSYMKKNKLLLFSS